MSQQVQKTSKKFYWLKLYHDFFNQDEIRIIGSQPNGKDYIIFYLKLMLKSINDNGKLLFKDTLLRVAIDAFIKLGLITLLDDGALFMQDVQKLIGSETFDAERMRIKRAAAKSQANLPLKNKARTNDEHWSKNVTLENKSLEKENRSISPYSPPTPDSENISPDFGVSSICAKNNYKFSEPELYNISQWLNYKTHKFEKIILPVEIEQTLSQLAEHKAKSYDIVGMIINRSIANGYIEIMSPTKEFMLSSKNGFSSKSRSRYPAPEYIILENREQRRQLCSYIDSCYRQKLNPKTGKPMTSDELKLIAAHFKILEQSSPPISWYDFIYQNEVLKGICLLNQPLT